MFPNARQTFWLLLAACGLLLAVALYMEKVMGLIPCPLCMTQRLFVLFTGLVALVALLHRPGRTGQRLYGVLGVGTSVLGGAFSTRQLWLQSLPPEKVPSCGPDLEYILETFPLMDALRVMLTGDGNCAEVTWSFLGLSIPAWTLIAFIVLALLNLSLIVRRR